MVTIAQAILWINTVSLAVGGIAAMVWQAMLVGDAEALKKLRRIPPTEAWRDLGQGFGWMAVVAITLKLSVPIVPGYATYWWLRRSVTGGNALLFVAFRRIEQALTFESKSDPRSRD